MNLLRLLLQLLIFICAVIVCFAESGAQIIGESKTMAQLSDVTPLLAAVGEGNVEKVRTLLKSGAKPDDPEVGRSPLIQAITFRSGNTLKCNLPMVQLLLDYGADPQRVDLRTGSVPLLEAFAIGDLECARILRKAGALASTHDAGGATILNAAVDSSVSRAGSTSIIDVAISWGADINGQMANGYTPLHEAVDIQSTRVIRALIERGANPCIKNKIGQTPLDMAINLSRDQVMIDVLRRATQCVQK